MSKDAVSDEYGNWRARFGALFAPFVGSARGRRGIFCLVFVSAFLYALFNDFAWGRPPESIANEVILICVTGSVALPLLAQAIPRLRGLLNAVPWFGLRWGSGRQPLILKATIFGALALWGFCQTQAFVALMSRLDGETESLCIRSMNESAEMRYWVAKQYSSRTGQEPPRGVEIHALFNESQQRRLREALAYLAENPSINDKLRQNLGVTLKRVDALILPGWEAHRPDDFERFGITEAAWQVYLRNEAPRQGAFTIREREGQPMVTADGRPRILINAEAFSDENTLRPTLFHQLLHALDVPGYSPSRFTLLQDDLTYLPVYRDIIREQQFLMGREYFIWFAAIILPLFLAARVAYRHSAA